MKIDNKTICLKPLMRGKLPCQKKYEPNDIFLMWVTTPFGHVSPFELLSMSWRYISLLPTPSYTIYIDALKVQGSYEACVWDDTHPFNKSETNRKGQNLCLLPPSCGSISFSMISTSIDSSIYHNHANSQWPSQSRNFWSTIMWIQLVKSTYSLDFTITEGVLHYTRHTSFWPITFYHTCGYFHIRKKPTFYCVDLVEIFGWSFTLMWSVYSLQQ